MATVVYTAKSLGTFLLLWAFLGGLGAHKLYLGKWGQAIGYILLTGLSLAIPIFLVAIAIWWIADLATSKSQIMQANEELARL